MLDQAAASSKVLQLLSKPGSGNGFSSFSALAASQAVLICCPHAGGGANFFRSWAAEMPANLTLAAVQYPGRENRMGEPNHTEMSQLIASLLPAFLALGDTPYILFGHSMGAAVAFELCALLEQLGSPPRALMLSSHPPLDEIKPSCINLRDERALWEEMIRIGGTSPQILDELELRKILTPVLQADYRLLESYRPSLTRKLGTQMVLCLGDNDPDVPVSRISGWQRFSTKPVRVLKWPGGHFYLTTHRKDLIGAAERALQWSPPFRYRASL